MSKPSVSVKRTEGVLFTPGKKTDHDLLHLAEEDTELVGIVTSVYQKENAVDLYVFAGGRVNIREKVPHANYANKGQGSWKKTS